VAFFTPSFRLVRPDDHVVLDISVVGFTQTHVDTPQGRRYILTVPDGGLGLMWVQFPSQQLLEYATPAPDPNPDHPDPVRATQNQPIYAPATDVVVEVPGGSPDIELSVAGILQALSSFKLRGTVGDPELPPARTLPRARSSAYALLAASAPNGTGTDAARSSLIAERLAEQRARLSGGAEVTRTTPGVVRPRSTPIQELGPAGQFPAATRFMLPRRLALRPPVGNGPRLSHASQPVTNTGRTELWTTRYAIRSDTPGEPPVEVPVDIRMDPLPRHPNPPPELSEAKLVNSLTDDDCQTFAGLSQNISPVSMSDLALSSLGGWVTLDGTWPDTNPNLPPRRLQHEVRQGRDQFQYKVLIGRLAPFGNLCVLTSTTRRSFEKGTRRAAALQTIASIDILEPTIAFPVTRVEKIDNVEFIRGEPWPWASMTVANPPDGIQEPIGDKLSRFLVGGADWRFEVIAVDRAGNSTTLRLPMLFAEAPIDDTDAPLPDVARTRWLELFAQAGLQLGGQPLAVTPVPDPPPPPPHPSGSTRATAGVPLPALATTVLANKVQLSFTNDGRPQVDKLFARLPSVDAITGTVTDSLPEGLGEVALSYAKPYTDSFFTSANAHGQLFLQMATDEASSAVLSLGKSAAGGLAGVDLPIAALSAAYGTVAGVLGDETSLTRLASGKVDLAFITDKVGSLLGLVPLNEILNLGADVDLKDGQHVISDVQDGGITRTITFDVPMFARTSTNEVVAYRKGFIELIPCDGNPDPRLIITQTLVADAQHSEVHTTTKCEVKDLQLRVFFKKDPPPTESPLVIVPFRTISITFRDTEKPEIDVQFASVQFGGLLSFVGVLAELIDDLGLSDPPALDVTPERAISSFSFQVPAVAVGMFALENVTFLTSLQLNFTTQPAVLLIVAFSTFDHPFQLTVSLLGGSGYLRIGAASDGLALVEGSLAFGAALSVNLGIAKGSVEAMGGVCFRYDRANELAQIVAFLRVRGELNVLGLVSVSVTVMITLTYEPDDNSLIGHAEYVVQVTALFFSQSVVVPFTWVIAGKSSDPTFAELMAPDNWEGELPWDTYCLAYA
jgi:hypothetical protein